MYPIYTTIAPFFPDKIFFQVETDLTNYNEGSCVPYWLTVKPSFGLSQSERPTCDWPIMFIH